MVEGPQVSDIRCGHCGESIDHTCGGAYRLAEMRKALADLFDALVDECYLCALRGIHDVPATHGNDQTDHQQPNCDECGRRRMAEEQAGTLALIAAGEKVHTYPSGKPETLLTYELPHAQLIRDIADLLDRTEPEET